MPRIPTKSWRDLIKDITGQKFGRLTAIEPEKQIRGGRWRAVWLCACDCGGDSVVDGSALRTGKIKSCGCATSEVTAKRNGINCLPSGVAEVRAVIRAYIQNSNHRGLVFDLTEDQVSKIIKMDCVYCGSRPSNTIKWQRKAETHFKYNGIDRADNSRGYVFGNCVPCCKSCNKMKDQMTPEEFMVRCGMIAQNQLRRMIQGKFGFFALTHPETGEIVSLTQQQKASVREITGNPDFTLTDVLENFSGEGVVQ